MLSAWINLHVGVSRRYSSTFLKALQFILMVTMDIIFSVFQSRVKPPTLNIPCDIRTVYQHGMAPDIIRTPCCPKCYKTYPLNALPLTCDWKKSPRSRTCGTELWKLRRSRNGTIKRVPKSLYSTQSFESWLKFFLGRSEVEAHLEKSFQQNRDRQHGDGAGPMNDLHHSPAWRSLGNFLLSRYHLVFGIYIDWFNPYTNKIAGMSIYSIWIL